MNGKKARELRQIARLKQTPRKHIGKVHKMLFWAVGIRGIWKRLLATYRPQDEIKADVLNAMLETETGADGEKKPLERLWPDSRVTIVCDCDRQAYQAMKHAA